jgi:uncharacterized protein DUF4013
MNFVELFKDSLYYPSKNLSRVIILGVLILIPSIFVIFPFLAGIFNQYVAFISLGIVSLILFIVFMFIVNGYYLEVIKDTVLNSETLPEFQWRENFIDGFKVFVVHFVYYIIPTAITLLVAYLTGFFGNFATLLSRYSTAVAQNSTAAAAGSTVVPPELLSSLYSSAIIVAIVAIILFIIFELFRNIATAKLAETGKLAAAFSIGEIFTDIGKIGWGNYIVWFILLFLILFVINAVVGALQTIPFLGFIISILSVILVSPYLLVFSGRALGLIYKKSKD